MFGFGDPPGSNNGADWERPVGESDYGAKVSFSDGSQPDYFNGDYLAYRNVFTLVDNARGSHVFESIGNRNVTLTTRSITQQLASDTNLVSVVAAGLTDDFRQVGGQTLFVSGRSVGDTIRLLPGSGSRIRVEWNGQIVAEEEALDRVYIDAGGGADVVTIEDGVYERLPVGGLYVKGADGEGDRVILRGNATREVTFTGLATDRNDQRVSEVSVDGGRIVIAGSPTLEDYIQTDRRVLQGLEPNGALESGETASFVLQDDESPDNSWMTFSSTTGGAFPTYRFAVPSLELEVSGSDLNDVIEIASVDSLYAGRLIVRGAAGDDTIDGQGLGFPLVVFGDEGDDTILGGTEADQLDGGLGNDTIRGEDGPDTIDGGLGTNQLFGGAGDDSFEAYLGFHTIDGGPDIDSLTANVMTIVELTSGRIEVAGSIDSGGVERSFRESKWCFWVETSTRTYLTLPASTASLVSWGGRR